MLVFMSQSLQVLKQLWGPHRIGGSVSILPFYPLRRTSRGLGKSKGLTVDSELLSGCLAVVSLD